MQETSLMSCIQKMIPESMKIVTGIVISDSPLRIQLINDEKMVLHKGIICLPKHLTDYETEISIDGGERQEAIVHNSLQVGELVYILSFNKGKKYYILDREG